MITEKQREKLRKLLQEKRRDPVFNKKRLEVIQSEEYRRAMSIII